jgi:hypothetical protein
MLGIALTSSGFTLGSFGDECRPGNVSLSPGISPRNHLLGPATRAYLTAAKGVFAGTLAIVSKDGNPILRQLRYALPGMTQRLHTCSRMKRAK